MQPPKTAARQEHEIAAQLLAKREAQMRIALAIKPPPHIVKELGERPTERHRGEDWDRGVRMIERYCREYGVTDRSKALGREPKDSAQRAARNAAEAA